MTAVWYGVYRTVWRALDGIFPPTCAGCGAPGTRWCATCAGQVQPLSPPLCRRCGTPCREEGICSRCKEQPPAFKQLRSWAVFAGPLRTALHHIKYRRDLALADALAVSLIDFYQRTLQWHLNMVIPVPLSARRRKERGYNQAGLFALPLALALQIPYKPQALERIRHTRSQVDLSWRERQQNVAGAFRAVPSQVTGKDVLLIDDVATTGATLNACATALYEAGARTVYALTVARAVSHTQSP